MVRCYGTESAGIRRDSNLILPPDHPGSSPWKNAKLRRLSIIYVGSKTKSGPAPLVVPYNFKHRFSNLVNSNPSPPPCDFESSNSPRVETDRDWIEKSLKVEGVFEYYNFSNKSWTRSPKEKLQIK